VNEVELLHELPEDVPEPLVSAVPHASLRTWDVPSATPVVCDTVWLQVLPEESAVPQASPVV